MTSPYLSWDELLERVDEPCRSGFQRLMEVHREHFAAARGSSRNHQGWTGGYLDHVREVMNLAVVLHDTLGRLRPLPFSLSDALVVLFVHDLEKPWAYEQSGDEWQRRERFGDKEFAQKFRLEQLAAAGVALSAEVEQAVFFVEGEGVRYSNRSRGMSPLAAFCHSCDVLSARLWHDFPAVRDDPWTGAERSHRE